MKLIIGLGNPGEKYKNNRHNVGYMVVDRLQTTARNKNLKICKTNTFMNDSGSFVKKLINHYSLAMSHLYVVHDDLDLRLGTWKLQLRKGPKDHGGINDIEHKLDTDNFWRVRVGVDNRDADNRTPGEEYVLQDFTDGEKKVLVKVISEICKKLATY